MRRIPLAALLSLALHALVALGASFLAWRAPEPAARAPRTIAWLTTPRTPPPAPRTLPADLSALEPEPRPPAQQAGPEDVSVEAAQDPAALDPATQDPATRTDTSAAPADRSAEADVAVTRSAEPVASRSSLSLSEAHERAIDSVMKERDAESSYRSFVFPGTLGEQRAFDEAQRQRRAEVGLRAPLTAFDSPSKGRAGLDERTALGVDVRWVSDDCYQTLGTGNFFILPSAQGLYGIPMTNCVRPRPRADLFADAQPTYLLDEQEREAAAQRSQRMERLRRPTTGVVMAAEE